MPDQSGPEKDLQERIRAGLAGRYALERILGRGGMASVHLARDIRHQRRVAIKVLHPHIATAIGAERFIGEIYTVARLQHPGIVPLFDSGETNGLLYYVMPYLDGGSLRDRIRVEKQLGVSDAIGVAIAVAEALAHAHGHGIVHRDIKPENILFSAGRPMVADFGIARVATQVTSRTLTAAGLAIGTAAYMSPEQASGVREVDARTDVYALGCVLFEMLTGQPPFTGATAEAIMARHALETPPSVRVVRPGVTASVDDAIRRALAKVPADRFATPTGFVAGLRSPQRMRVPVRRIAAGAALVAAAAIAAIGLASRKPSAARTLPPADLSRIAVLYFDDATREDSLQWLAHGLSEDLIDALTAVDGLTVTTRSGVRQYLDSSATPDSIGRALGVSLIVDGTVEPADGAGHAVRVTLRLVDAVTGVQLERISATRPAGEPLALRHDLTEELEHVLRQRIGQHVRLQQERFAAGNDVAWEQLRRAREWRAEGIALLEAGDDAPAARLFVRADSLLANAEVSAPAWLQPTVERAALALNRSFAAGSAARAGTGSDSMAAVLAEGLRHAERALGRKPDDPGALAVHGELMLTLWRFSDAPPDSLLATAYSQLERATRLPESPPHAWYALSEALLALGRSPESRVAARRALRDDIYAEDAPSTIGRLFQYALDRGDVAEADSLCTFGRRYYGTNPNFLECEFALVGWFGDTREEVDRARALTERLDTVRALEHGRLPRRMLLAAVLARAGLRTEAMNELATARALAPDSETWNGLAPYEAYVELLLGNRMRAVEILDAMVKADGSARAWVAEHRWFRPLHQDSSFRKVVGAT